MYTVLIVIHMMITLSLIGIILVQRNSGDMGLSGSSSTSFMSGRATATFVTRATSVLAAIFILMSLGIGILTAHNHETHQSIMDKLAAKPATATQTAAKPVEPAKPATLPAAPQTAPQPAVPHPE